MHVTSRDTLSYIVIYIYIEVLFRQRATTAINAATINTATAINIFTAAINTKFPYNAASAVTKLT